MVDTLPDYSSRGRNDSVAGVQDMSELACRLKSIHTHDRRGEVVWLDDMEHGIGKWNVQGAGTGNSQGISATTSRNGDSSVKLVSGNDGARFARMFKIMQLPLAVGTGFEMSFTYADELDYILMQMSLDNGTGDYLAWLKIDQVNKKVQYYDDAGNYVDTGITFEPYDTYPLFTTVKVVANRSTGKYSRVIFGNQEVDLSAESMIFGAAGPAPRMTLDIYAYSTAANNATVYVDDVIITQNEA